MSLNPEDYLFGLKMMAKELEQIEQEYDTLDQKIFERQQLRDEERQKTDEKLKKEMSDAVQSSMMNRKILDMEYTIQQKRREGEIKLRREREKEAADDRTTAWSEHLRRDVVSRELRQQHLDRDFAREKANRLDQLTAYEGTLHARKMLHDSVTNNVMMVMEKRKTDTMQMLDARNKHLKAWGDMNAIRTQAYQAKLAYSQFQNAIEDRK